MLHRAVKLLLLLALLPVLASAVTQQSKHFTWKGTVELGETFQVELGAILEVAPGTRVKVSSKDAKLMVQGRLLVLGTADSPVVFEAPAGWQGIEFVEAEAGSRIEYTHFKNCSKAISVFATSPEIRYSRFENCGVGVDLLRESKAFLENNLFKWNDFGLKVSMKSMPQVINNHFSGNLKVGLEASNNGGGMIEANSFAENNIGLSVQRVFSGEIRGNHFEKNKVGFYSYQTRNSLLLEDNTFVGNEVGLSAFTFSYPALRNNRFVDNKFALRNDQFGSALVEGNLFRKNDTAIYNYRKSNPQIRHNQFEENRLVLYIDYSSYPEVKLNNFVGNQKIAELGIYQSADWEKRAGSKNLVRQKALERKSRNPLLEQAPTEFSDRVDLSENWWGDDTSELEKVGEDSNLELLYDRRDKSEISYPGYGDERYQLDVIIYSPWLKQPVKLAGPQDTP